jgi:hypothetical protein
MRYQLIAQQVLVRGGRGGAKCRLLSTFVLVGSLSMPQFADAVPHGRQHGQAPDSNASTGSGA